METTTDSGVSFVSESYTFVSVVPTGLVVAAFAGGMSEVVIGSGQGCVLAPAQFSRDYDNLTVMSELTFKFYCKVLGDVSDEGYPSTGVGKLTDLTSLEATDGILEVKT